MPYDDNGNWVEDRDEDGMDQGDTTGDGAINPNDLDGGGSGSTGTGDGGTTVVGGGDTNTDVTEVNEVTGKGDTKGSKTDPNDTVGDGVTDTGDSTTGGGDTGTGGDTDTGGGDTGTGGGDTSTSSEFILEKGSVAEAGDVDIPESTTGHGTERTNWDVTDEQTVSGQLEELYDRDSPFFERARQNAMRRMQAAGGQNSAMAGAAGELAAMDTAFKVAFEDAKVYARSAEFNAAMANQFSLAEQKFIHNALLSDQAYEQAKELQMQRIDAQFEAIRMDFEGKGMLMDKDLDQWFAKAAQQQQYALDMLWEQEEAFEGREERGFERKMTLEGMLSMSNFYTSAMESVMAATANLKNPAAQAESMRAGMAWLDNKFNLLQSFWGSWGAGGPTGEEEANWLGQYGDPTQASWWDFNTSMGG